MDKPRLVASMLELGVALAVVALGLWLSPILGGGFGFGVPTLLAVVAIALLSKRTAKIKQTRPLAEWVRLALTVLFWAFAIASFWWSLSGRSHM